MSLATRAANELASLPDRGELLAYDAPPGQRLAGERTAYRVRLSEAHAFNAAHEGGKITVPTPDGGVTTLTYERHVEHPDGNWSWVGRDEQGADAILTFGEKAVFGTIPQANGRNLRLTTLAGATWIARTDRSKAAAMGGKSGSDVMLPPSMAGDKSQSETPGSHNNITMVATDAVAATTVDVLLGYTNGYASALGGQSQAVTRLTNLVDISNQAYANSGITARLRLVGTRMVTFPDNTDNGNALEKLSGQTQTGPTTPDPAFAALRSARDTLGADLVALVRDFRSPENNGCGIAWLIGGGQTGITQADAPFGYSVVSDGSDVNEGDGFDYFCRDESLAHELGHNMGQAHNQENSNQSGVHAYSYGYRETTNAGFYTVMAYALPDSDQTSIRYFANPGVNYQGRPTGVANQSDNTRSMNQSMPVVATFRASRMGGKRNDVDGDGKSDILLRNGTASVPNNFSYWIMNGAARTRIGTETLAASYRIAATGDFNGDGKLDLVWTSSSRDVRIWFGDGTRFGGNGPGTFPAIVGSYAAGWEIVGAGDVDGDGKSDILLRNGTASVPNNFSYWIMNGTARTRIGNGTLAASYRVAATGDFNGDGKLDLVWTSASRDVRIWFGDGTNFGGNGPGTFPAIVGSYAAGWEIVGAGDVDGDGKSDILLRNGTASVPNNFSYWIMNGTARTRIGNGTLAASYRVAATGDYNGDGKLDLVWTSASRDVRIWFGDGTNFGGNGPGTFPVIAGSYAVGWEVVK